MRTFLYAIFIGFLLTGHVFSTPPSLEAQQSHAETQELFPNLDPVQIGRLLGGEQLNHRYSRDITTQLAPDAAATERIRNSVEGISPSFGLEALYFFPSTQAQELAPERLYNLTRAISTMEGLEYTKENSTTRKTLYKEAYAINNPDTARRIPDPVVQRVPREASLYALQDDDGFGRNIYKVDHFHDSGVIHVQMSNLTTVRMGFVPVIRPDRFLLHFMLFPTKNGLFFYANGAMRVPAIMTGFEGLAQDGLSARLDALNDWFVTQLEDAIAQDL